MPSKDWYRRNREKAKETTRLWRARNRGYRRRQHLFDHYKITPKQYEEMVRQHNGVCAACLEPPKNNKRLTVDHNHLTGKVRGLLCFQCNQAYGLVRERPSVLEGLYLYGVHHEGIEYMGIYTEPISNHDTSGDIQQLNLFSIVSTEDDLEQAA